MTVKAYEVRFYFRGAIITEVVGDPEDDEGWLRALNVAILRLLSAEPGGELDDLLDRLDFTGHDIAGEVGDQHCDECGALVITIIDCPDGAEVCQGCFDKGLH